MALTETPDNFASSYSCNYCGISSQVLLPAKDENGADMFREDGTQMFYNDDQAASTEISEHIESTHPVQADAAS